MKLKVGDKAPDFELNVMNGEKVKLSQFREKKVVLYFYPKDNTPGCTIEACEFRDLYNKFNDKAIILGISPDNEESHQKFAQKFDLPFRLLCDTNKEICKKYGVWGKKKLYGKEYMGVLRTTFLIDERGNVAKIFEKVSPKGHVEEVLKTL